MFLAHTGITCKSSLGVSVVGRESNCTSCQHNSTHHTPFTANLRPPRTLYNTHRLSVCLFVCLFVCLLATFIRKTTERIFTKILSQTCLCTKKKLIKYWHSSASGSGSWNFLKDSSTLRDRAFFHNVAYISGKSGRIFITILSQMYPWTRKSLLNFASNPDQEFKQRQMGYSITRWSNNLVSMCTVWDSSVAKDDNYDTLRVILQYLV